MIPHYFKKEKIPEKLPEEMEQTVKQLRNSVDKEDCLRKAYDIITNRYHGHRFVYIFKIFGALKNKTVNELWKHSGYLHCNFLNYLLRILLIKSGFF